MPEDKRKKILTYTLQGTLIEKTSSIISIISRYAIIVLTLFLPVYNNIYYILIGNLLYFAGLVLSTLAVWQFSKEREDRPITWGLYRISRHPMQVSGSIMCIGIALIANNIWLWVLTILNTICSYPMFLMQERYCTQRYGKEYTDYMNKTPRIFLIKSTNK
ncbi:MAG: methyltransferase family protein [Acetivibrionales bacterium]